MMMKIGIFQVCNILTVMEFIYLMMMMMIMIEIGLVQACYVFAMKIWPLIIARMVQDFVIQKNGIVILEKGIAEYQLVLGVLGVWILKYQYSRFQGSFMQENSIVILENGIVIMENGISEY